jgi:hypothetical protein
VSERRSILVLATKGSESNDEVRILELLSAHDVETFPFDRANKIANVLRLLRTVRRLRPALAVMEGTGVAGGVSLLIARLAFGTRYVVSSGDAVGPFVASSHPALGPFAWAYEWLLCRMSAGFIGWTPYLVGRALTMGAPRAATAAGFTQHPELVVQPAEIRSQLGIAEDAVVFGIVGSLDWNARRGYCYGLELVKAVRQVARDDVVVVVVGDGSGMARLRDLAGSDLGRTIFLTGAIPQPLVTSYLAALDVGSLPQSVDQVGSFRFTTKISEYATARLPIVTGQIPLAYDLAREWSWRLPGDAPWADDYIAALAQLMANITRDDVAEKATAIPQDLPVFDRETQKARVAAFIDDLL